VVVVVVVVAAALRSIDRRRRAYRYSQEFSYLRNFIRFFINICPKTDINRTISFDDFSLDICQYCAKSYFAFHPIVPPRVRSNVRHVGTVRRLIYKPGYCPRLCHSITYSIRLMIYKYASILGIPFTLS